MAEEIYSTQAPPLNLDPSVPNPVGLLFIHLTLSGLAARCETQNCQLVTIWAQQLFVVAYHQIAAISSKG